MRTRRIAIRCRRTGRSAAVAIGTTGTGAPVDLPGPEAPPGLAVPPSYESLPVLDLPPLYGTPPADAPSDHIASQRPVPPYLSDPERAPGDDAHGPANPWRSNRGPDLTLADLLARPGRRNLDWNRNPGWPAGVGWSYIARGRSPRHARTGGWRIPGPAVAWTGAGMLAAAVLMLVADLLG